MADRQEVTRYQQSSGPSSSQVVAVVTLLPLGGLLLLLAGFTLTGTLLGLAVATPVFVIFSPVLVPAALTILLAIAGFVVSGAFGVTALSAFSWMVNFLRRSRLPEQFQHAKQRTQEAAGQLTEKAKEAGQAVQGKAQEASGKSQSKTQEATGGKPQDVSRT